ncbi:terminase small subunit [Pasteurella skyensis]|uniref:Terminase small subunit n=1 Tax=Phocoenobacter skyensis TaxID=97481 RepID=A0AAJ6P0J6_9PAST|nr:terminase small subunit [Pasteurella skyensis]MDP8162189.1 terminase small subunit [Pasteurella skyensis]MDP8172653.1 terminase small subunit [Pasteurella skyensis]MDP8176815.1 terminase small subunit [Pasteurella skyensis]MDP8179153.1 terminase small subunit [Pasteurella skyensis]MDP8183392.1 terminase small subunit [Pasteurella skyensis]
MTELTPKQELFCEKYIELGNASEAYRQSYNAENMKDDTVHRKAFDLLENGKITARLNELRKEHLKRHNITVDSLILDLERVFNEAMDRDNPNFSSAVSAKMGQAKILGFDKQVIEHSTSDNTLRPTVIKLVAPDFEDKS